VQRSREGKDPISCRMRFRPAICPASNPIGRQGGQRGRTILARQAGIQEADLRDGIRDGGRVQSALAIVRATRNEPQVVVYLRVSWTLGYHILCRWRGKGERIFRTADAALQTIWRHGYRGPVVVYRAGDPELARFRALSPQDRGKHESTKSSGAEMLAIAPVAANLGRAEQPLEP